MSVRALLASLLLFCSGTASTADVGVGSKNFTENYILAEIAAQLLEARGFDVQRRMGLNGTKIIYEALVNNSISVYPEYTGTITEVILRQPELRDLAEIRAALATLNLTLLDPLGFNNSYAIAIGEDFAARENITRISDLRGRDGLRVALPHEFLQRPDGWPGLTRHYGLSLPARGIEHSLAYNAMAESKIDVTAVYTTDGEIQRSGLRLLEDDLGYFPRYLAAFLANESMPPTAAEIIGSLSGRIDEARMQALNLRALDPSVTIAEVAASFLVSEGLIAEAAAKSSILPQLLRNTQRHLKLTVIALLLAILAGVGIAVSVHRHRGLSNAFLYVTGLLQTIPSIALLALMIPLVGVGQKPAIIALFLYSLLPIARSTITAMHAIPPTYRQVAAAMAMTRLQELRYVLLPLAMPHVLAGIRTAAVICIGTATLAAFIGAGGLGDPIVTGLALNDSSLILQGALPAAGLAILTELFFGAVERWLVVPHMRSNSQPH
ncbi:MAG: ABC transporter permease subunit [Woeseia sp.]|nr:ABC transporter permease subunit [Woeseia sp.]MBT8095476.1 ABC transporter permease subunit [Woeseia sp.]NNE61027.1 ABC transporter permease subunit [Woeseia sp.]NNL55025.1 ABC transporter permease subunit [Woeseia sp.]